MEPGPAGAASRSGRGCGRTARGAPLPRASGTRGNGRGPRPWRRSSPPSPARWSATTVPPPLAGPGSEGSWPGCRPAHEAEPHSVRPEGRARQSRPLDRVLAFFDPLLRRPPPVVDSDHLLGRAMEVRHDETDARIQLAGMPLHLRYDSTRPTPALRLIAEARVEAPDVVWWASHGPREQVGDPILEHLVGGQADRVPEALRLQVLVHVRQREGRIAAQQAPEGLATIPRDHRLEHLAPPVGTVHVPRPQRASLQVAVLVEHEQRVVAGASEVAVVCGAFLRAVGRAHAAV